MRSFIGNFRKLGNLSKPWVSGGSPETIFGVPPITTNKHKLLSLKAFGGTEQRSVLPSEYTQVEYLESTGTQYIDTGVKGNGNTKVEIKWRYSVESTEIGSGRIFGSQTGSTQDSFVIGTVLGIASSSTRYLLTYDSQNYIDSGVYVEMGVWATIIHSRTIHIINGTDYTRVYDSATFETPQSLKIFAFDNNGTVGFGIGVCAYAKIWDNDILVRNLIPCRRNSDNVLGMYDTVTGNFLTNQGTGTFIAGADVTTPSPEIPMDILCNNGVLKVNTEVSGKNAVDISDVVPGYLSSNPGREPVIQASSASQVIKKAIRVSSGKQYKFSYVSTIAGNRESEIVGEDGLCKAKFNLSCSAGLNEYILNASFDGYLWITVQSGDLDIVSPVIYEIGQIYADGIVETIQVHGKNLFDEQYEAGIYSIITGEKTPSNNRIRSVNLIRVLPSTTYVTSSSDDAAVMNLRVVQFDINGQFLRNTSVVRGNFTVNEKCYYIGIYFATNYTVETAPSWVQIEQGSTATAYEPYYNGGTATAEMLLKAGDYQDIQSILDGVVTRNVGIKVFNGTELWASDAVGTGGYIRFNLSVAPCKKPGFNILTNAFVSQSGVVGPNATSAVISGHGTNTNIYLTFPANLLDGDLTTNMGRRTAFNNWLADQYNSGTPVIMVYPLETPTTEQVAGQTLTLKRGTNIIDITQASLDNLKLEVEVK